MSERVNARRQALQTLGQSLRRSSAGRSAGTMLLREDYEAAAVEMVGLANTVRDLNDSDRDSLSEQLAAAAQKMASDDPNLADTTQRAAESLRQYQDLAASNALMEMAQQTAQTGQLSQEQEQLAQRAQQLREDQAVGLPGESVQAPGNQRGERRALPEVGDPTEGMTSAQEAGAANTGKREFTTNPAGGPGDAEGKDTAQGSTPGTDRPAGVTGRSRTGSTWPACACRWRRGWARGAPSGGRRDRIARKPGGDRRPRCRSGAWKRPSPALGTRISPALSRVRLRTCYDATSVRRRCRIRAAPSRRP